MRKRFILGITAALILLSVALNYTIHFNYPLPAHSDEYDHLAVINEMAVTEGTTWYDPYIVEKRATRRNLELNYDVFLLSFYYLTGMELLYIPLVIPVLFTFLLCLGTFVFIRYLTRRNLPALFAAIFVLFLHNNIAFLGYWFLVPMAFGLAMIPVISYLFLKAMDSWAFTIMLYLVIINMTLMHAVYVVIFIPVFFLSIIFNPGHIRANIAKIVLGVIILAGLSHRFVAWDLSNLTVTFQKIIDFLIWPYGTNVPSYPLLPYLTPIMMVLSAIGLVYLLLPLIAKAKGRLANLLLYTKQDKLLHHAKFPLLFIITLLSIRIYADFFGPCFLGPCRRTTPGLAIMLFATAGIGLYAIINFIGRTTTNMGERKTKLIHTLLLLGVIAFLLNQTINEPFTHTDRLYRNIEIEEARPIEWIGENYGKDRVILALPWVAKPVHLISGMKVNDTGAARLGTGLGALKDVINFNSLDCTEKTRTLEKYNSDIVYSGRGFIDCEGFDLVYNKGGYMVYVPNK